ncbi:C40 family peptidase, partial [Mordavella massiliensis]|nr:C40 family peptidase [Mordavella massiliensis]
VYSDYIIIGKNAEEKAREVGEEAFVYAESKAEEEARLKKEAEEAAQKAAEEAAAKAGTGQAIVDYACQFIGNPYVWGGTSLTEGADCSGFVQSVFAHFGISLPRTTWDMENVGTPVSYDQAVAGDIILYDGHVGIYMGNGEIVNAINSRRGIGILPATYTNILTVRRLI